MPALSRFVTHEVTNQSPPYEDVDLFASDPPLQDAVRGNGAGADADALSAFGRRWGAAEMFELARQANENPPKLRIFDAKGYRCDIVEFHPAYHVFMTESIAARLQASTWHADAGAAAAPAQVARAARFYMAAQVETGHLCPITMTRAAVAALASEPPLAAKLMPKIATGDYDRNFRPWWEKKGMTLGMGMTEKQGGTDVRRNTTQAVPVGEGYAVTGHKWFMSAPMCDAFLVLAQAPGGLTCFLMPRFRPDGSVNALHFQRLKDKLGNRSNASAEVEFADAFAWRIGEEGRGVRTIIQMVQLTRLDCAIASAGLMRMALAQAIHHTRHRTVFQRRLADQPMMRTVLADMALAVEAATMECLGGNGYVEESVLPRLYREAPVNAIWEGSGNVMCLDVLRALAHEREAAHAMLAALADEAAGLSGVREAVAPIAVALSAPDAEAGARAAIERLALVAAAAALQAGGPADIAETFARVRLSPQRGELYGSGAIDGGDAGRQLERALPA